MQRTTHGQQAASPVAGTGRRKVALHALHTEGLERQGGVAVTEPPGGWAQVFGPNQLPDGTGRRQAVPGDESRIFGKRQSPKIVRSFGASVRVLLYPSRV